MWAGTHATDTSEFPSGLYATATVGPSSSPTSLPSVLTTTRPGRVRTGFSGFGSSASAAATGARTATSRQMGIRMSVPHPDTA
jgi:hypothetical protein